MLSPIPGTGRSPGSFSGTDLRRVREGRKVSLRALARQACISAPYLHDVELERRTLNAELTQRLFGCLCALAKKPVNVLKCDHFEAHFPYPLRCVEWDCRWPLKHKNGKTYNPDYFCEALGCFIEVVTSSPNYSDSYHKWKKAIETKGLRVFWWEGGELTEGIRRLMSLSVILADLEKTP